MEKYQKVWRWVFILGFLMSCAAGKIVGDSYIDAGRGFQFSLPGGDWAVDRDAWVYARDFGVLIYRTEDQVAIYQDSGDSDDVEKVFIAGKVKEKLLFNVPVGFRHVSHDMRLVVATISEGDLIEFLEWGRGILVRGPQENLIRNYLELYPSLHRSLGPGPVSVETQSLPGFGEMGSLKWTPDVFSQIILGVPLQTNGYLFFLLRAGPQTPQHVIGEAFATLRSLVETRLRIATPDP